MLFLATRVIVLETDTSDWKIRTQRNSIYREPCNSFIFIPKKLFTNSILAIPQKNPDIRNSQLDWLS